MPGFEWKGDLTCSIGVRDLKKAIEWYTTIFGFKVLYVVEEISWCEMATHIPDVTVGVGEREKLDVRDGATLVFGTKDIEAARMEFEAKGVRFDGPTITIDGMVKLATFFDPDGNKFMFSQSLSH